MMEIDLNPEAKISKVTIGGLPPGKYPLQITVANAAGTASATANISIQEPPLAPPDVPTVTGADAVEMGTPTS